MSNVTRNLKLLWRSEQILAEAKLSLLTRKLVLGVVAGIACLLAWGMINIALFFAFEPKLGQAWSAAIVGGLDFVFAAILIMVAQNLRPAPEEDMVREVRDIALSEIGSEVDEVQEKLQQVRNDMEAAREGITKFVSRPMDILSPALIGPAVATISKMMKSGK
jgi:type VI protein secretion system component VasK